MSKCLHPPSIQLFACKRCIWRVHEQPSLCFNSVVFGDERALEHVIDFACFGTLFLVAECEYFFAAFSSSVIVLHVPMHFGSACINAPTHAALLHQCNESGASLDAL